MRTGGVLIFLARCQGVVKRAATTGMVHEGWGPGCDIDTFPLGIGSRTQPRSPYFDADMEVSQVLVTTLRQGDTLVLTLPNGREIVLKAIEIRSGKLRLGVDADRDVRVRRGEQDRYGEAREVRETGR